jgi:hypothetical protein
VTLYADVTAALVGNPQLPPDTDQPPPPIQSVAEAPALIQSAADPQALPPAAKDVPARDELAASEPATQDPAEKSAPTSKALFEQFQAWASEQDAQANARADAQAIIKPAIEDTPAKVVEEATEKAPVPHRLKKRHRHVLSVRNARAEARTEDGRKKVRRPPSARAERPPVEDARTQGQPVQNGWWQLDPARALISHVIVGQM